jgi:hypothetical protein
MFIIITRWGRCGLYLGLAAAGVLLGASLVFGDISEIKVPDDNKDGHPQGGSSSWVRIRPGWVASGAGGNVRAQKLKRVKKIKIRAKAKAGEKPERHVKLTKIKYTPKATTSDPNPEEKTVDLVATGPGEASDADLPDDIDWDKPVYVQNTTHDPETGNVSTPGDDIHVNYYFLDTSSVTVVSVPTGGSTWLAVDEGGDPVTVTGVAQLQLGLSAGDYVEPDLILVCFGRMYMGTVLFTPVGQFRFTSLPAAIHVFDGGGTDLVQTGAIELGTPSLTPRGDLALPILQADEALYGFAVMVRGVTVTMNGGADTNSIHGYTVGGSAIQHLLAGITAVAEGTRVLDNWEDLPWTPAFALGSAAVPVEVDEQTIEVNVGQPMTATVSGSDNVGYRDALVVAGAEADAIGNGTIVFRGVSGIQFVADSNTKLYIVDADNGDHLSSGVTATLAVNSYGDLVVNLADLASVHEGKRVKIVVTAPKVAYTAPVSTGVAYDVTVFGSAVRSPWKVPSVYIEGDPAESQDPSGGLATQPLQVVGWTPAATCAE